MANCANCERELPEGRRGFCDDCTARFAEMRTDDGGRSDGGGLGSAIGGILRALSSRGVGIGIVVAISAVTGGFCLNRDDDAIEDQNRAAEGLASDNEGERVGRKSVFELRAGDCVGNSTIEEETVLLVDCADPGAQLRVVDLIRVEDADDYPTDSYFDEQAGLRCGIETTSYIIPSEETWELGDRVITCLTDEVP